MSAVALALFCPWLYACHSSVPERYLFKFKKSRLAHVQVCRVPGVGKNLDFGGTSTRAMDRQ